MTLSKETIENLASRMSDVDAAKELGVAMGTFYKARKLFNVPSYFEATGKRKTKSGKIYSFMEYNDRYFQSIDSPDKAYFLGLIASDGNISPRLTAARIALKAEDADILEKFRSFLGAGAPTLKNKIPTLKGIKGNPQKILVLSRKVLVGDLMELGITPNKSHTLTLNCDLKEFKKDFIRGVWDGDGSITERRFKVTTASEKFALQLQDWIEEISGIILPIKPEITKNNKKLFNLPGYVKDADAIHAIYKNSSLHMERKFKAYVRYWEPRR